MLNIKYILIGTAFIALLSSCNSWDKPEPIPAYVYIPELKLANKPSLGTLKQDFTESWVYDNGNLLGAFPIPSLIPIIGTGEHTLSIYSGIHNFGIRTMPILYPLLDKIDVKLTLASGKVDTIFPVVKYRDDITAAIIEDFEGGSSTFSTKFTTKGLELTKDDPFEGKQCGVFNLDTINAFISVGSNDISTFPTNGRRVFLELYFKSDVKLLVQLKGFDNTDEFTDSIELLNPSDEWKKVYIEITDQVQASQYKNHKIVLQTGLPIDGTGFLKLNGKVWIDNFKVLY